jgi:hypothetical protein
MKKAMPLPDRVRHILDTIGQAAAEVPCAVEDCREFVSVWKAHSRQAMNFAKRFPHLSGSEWVYSVCRFRVRSELIELDVNVGPDDLWDHERLTLADEELLVAVLSMWLGDLEVLGRPADCAIPI